VSRGRRASIPTFWISSSGSGRSGGWRICGWSSFPARPRSAFSTFRSGGGERIAGYVEAKRPGTNLDPVEGSEQLRRYRKTFPTSSSPTFGSSACTVTASRPCGRRPERSRTARSGCWSCWTCSPALHPRRAPRRPPWRSASPGGHASLRTGSRSCWRGMRRGARSFASFYQAFREFLLAGLKIREFADLYAQTLTYGLLAGPPAGDGAIRHRQTAARGIPVSSGILREVFLNISLGEPHLEIAWIVDEIVAVLAAAPVRAMLERGRLEGTSRSSTLPDLPSRLRPRSPQAAGRLLHAPGAGLVRGALGPPAADLPVRPARRPRGPGSDAPRTPPPAPLTFVGGGRPLRHRGRAQPRWGDGGVPPLLRDHVLRGLPRLSS